MLKTRRITVRISEETYQALSARKLDLGSDLSHALRDVLIGSLKPEIPFSTPQKPILRPGEIDQLIDDYRAIVDEDIRSVRKRLFNHLLAASFVTRQNFPRTPGVVDGYQSLLRLLPYFGYKDNV